MSTPPHTRGRAAISWGLVDQVVSSGATFLFIVIAAKSLSAPEVGAVAIVFELYLLSVFVARGLAGDPLTSRFSGTDPTELRRHIRAAASVAMGSGIAIGLLTAVAACFTDPPIRHVLLVAAVAMPALTLQDFVRAALIVQGRVKSTLRNDAFWAFGQLPVLGAAILIHPTAPVVFGAWAATGAAAAAIGLFQLRSGGVGGIRQVRTWLRENRDLWPYYLGDNLLYEVTTLLFVVVVSATAGLAAMAGFRVAMTVYAPLALIGRGLMMVATAGLARRRHDPAGVRRSALLISTVLTPMAIVAGLLSLLVPTWLGQAFFGESWLRAEPLVFLASFVCAAGLFSTGISIGLRALSAGRHSLAGRIIVSVGASSAGAVGGILGGEHGLFLALAWFFPVQVLVWSGLLNHATWRAIGKIRTDRPVRSA